MKFTIGRKIWAMTLTVMLLAGIANMSVYCRCVTHWPGNSGCSP